MTVQLPPGRWIKRSEYLLDECPKCGKSKHCYWNAETEWTAPSGEVMVGAGICHSCGLRWRGKRRFEELLKGKLLDMAAPLLARPARGVMSAPGMLGRCAWDFPEARVFLTGRGIGEPLARELPIGWVPEQDSLLVPVEPLSPEFPRAMLYRRIGNRETKWLPFQDHKSTVYGFGVRAWERGSHRGVILMEGIFDVLAPGLRGSALALLGTSLQGMNWPAYLQSRGVQRVGLWLDCDEPGQDAARKLARVLKGWGFDCVTVTSPQDPKRYRSGPAMGALAEVLLNPSSTVPANVGKFVLSRTST